MTVPTEHTMRKSQTFGAVGAVVYHERKALEEFHNHPEFEIPTRLESLNPT